MIQSTNTQSNKQISRLFLSFCIKFSLNFVKSNRDVLFVFFVPNNYNLHDNSLKICHRVESTRHADGHFIHLVTSRAVHTLEEVINIGCVTGFRGNLSVFVGCLL